MAKRRISERVAPEAGDNKAVAEEARLLSSIIRVPEWKGLQMLQHHPELWKALTVEQEVDPSTGKLRSVFYRFDADVIDGPVYANNEAGETDD